MSRGKTIIIKSGKEESAEIWGGRLGGMYHEWWDLEGLTCVMEFNLLKEKKKEEEGKRKF